MNIPLNFAGSQFMGDISVLFAIFLLKKSTVTMMTRQREGKKTIHPFIGN